MELSDCLELTNADFLLGGSLLLPMPVADWVSSMAAKSYLLANISTINSLNKIHYHFVQQCKISFCVYVLIAFATMRFSHIFIK